MGRDLTRSRPTLQVLQQLRIIPQTVETKVLDGDSPPRTAGEHKEASTLAGSLNLGGILDESLAPQGGSMALGPEMLLVLKNAHSHNCTEKSLSLAIRAVKGRHISGGGIFPQSGGEK